MVDSLKEVNYPTLVGFLIILILQGVGVVQGTTKVEPEGTYVRKDVHTERHKSLEQFIASEIAASEQRIIAALKEE